jgi:3-hydroxyacyl-[acyl-carrier-protein] dehydratase
MMGDETLGVADITEILRLLPHRYPFLLIDRLIDIRGEDHAIGIKNVMNEAHFAGHFPDNPVMPGVLMVEGLAQTAAVLVLRLMPLDKARLDNSCRLSIWRRGSQAVPPK